jgi:hypothetical protein
VGRYVVFSNWEARWGKKRKKKKENGSFAIFFRLSNNNTSNLFIYFSKFPFLN